MKLLIIGGATASGKTSLSIDVAKKINGEIISCDSMQVYRGMDVGTNKVSPYEMQSISHYMIDILNVDEQYSVAEYEKQTVGIINKLIDKNVQPIIVGGTGYYINAIIKKQSFGLTEKSDTIRKNLEKRAEFEGNKKLFEELKQVDFESYCVLHENDTKRIIRALEIYYLTGKKKSQQNDNELRYQYKSFIIDIPRDILYDRINLRVDDMFKHGLIDEVKSILNKNPSKTSLSAIGYKEVVSYLNNEIDFESCIEQVKQNTRHYAKRQITWFKHQLDTTLIPFNLSRDDMTDYLLEKFYE